MLRQVVLRRKLCPSSNLGQNGILASQNLFGADSIRKQHFAWKKPLVDRPKTFKERVETDYYPRAAEAAEAAMQKKEEEAGDAEPNTIDRLFRFRPLQIDSDGEDEFEGVPEHRLDDDYYRQENGDPDPRRLLGKSLLQLGKVHYRHSDKLPTWFLDRQEEIGQYRTNPQIRKCLKDWMVKSDRDLLDKYRKRRLKWGHQTSHKDKLVETHTYGPDETIAYSHFFLSSRFAVLNRVLREIRTLNNDFTPKRVFDFGCGPATGAASVREVFDLKDFKYTGVDISQSMIDAGKIMTRDEVPNSVFFTSNSEVVRRALQTSERYDLIIASFSINELANDPSRRVATQMLYELLDVGGHLVIIENGNPYGSHTVRTARQFILDTFNHIDKNGRSSPGSHYSTFFDTRKAEQDKAAVAPNPYGDEDDGVKTDKDDEEEVEGKDYKDFNLKKSFMNKKEKNRADQERRRKDKDKETELYKMTEMMLPPPKTGGFSHEELGAYVIAPCTHDRPCPLATGVWCSFSQKVYSGVIRKANEEKYSYVVVQKRPKNSAYNYSSEGKPKPAAAAAASDAADPSLDNPLPGTRPDQRGKYGRWLESTPTTVFEKGDRSPAALDALQNPTPLSVLERFINAEEKEEVAEVVDALVDEVDWEEYNPPLYREEWGRLVRSPIKSKGHITLDLCTPEGQVLRSTLGKANLLHVPALYGSLRKTTWGGLFPVLGAHVERSSLSKNSKGMRYKGGDVVDNEVVTFEKHKITPPAKNSGKKEGKGKNNKEKDMGGKGGKKHDITGLHESMQPTAEMITASKSKVYRRMLEAQAAREQEEQERAEAARLLQMKNKKGGSGAGLKKKSGSAGESPTAVSSTPTNESEAAASAAMEKPPMDPLKAQLERMKAKRAAKAAAQAAAAAAQGGNVD